MSVKYTTIPLRVHNHSVVAEGGQVDHSAAHTTASLAADDHSEYVNETPQENTARCFALLTLYG